MSCAMWCHCSSKLEEECNIVCDTVHLSMSCAMWCHCSSKLEKEKKQLAKDAGMIKTEVTGAEVRDPGQDILEQLWSKSDLCHNTDPLLDMPLKQIRSNSFLQPLWNFKKNAVCCPYLGHDSSNQQSFSALLLRIHKNRCKFDNNTTQNGCHLHLFSCRRVSHNSNYVAYTQMPGCLCCGFRLLKRWRRRDVCSNCRCATYVPTFYYCAIIRAHMGA